MPRQRTEGSGKDAGTLLAVLGLFVISGFLVFLTAMVLPQVLGIVIVVTGFACTAAFHYLVWGWWLSRRIRSEKPSDAKDQPWIQ